jgi:hypothetical protein
MNIFVTDRDPIKAAQALDNKRLNKMIIESAQMLSTAMHVLGVSTPPYKITHKNHPCAVWARTTRGNYLWLYSHYVAMLDEYRLRFVKYHKCGNHQDALFNAAQAVPDGPLQEFVNCTPYKMIEVVLAYRFTMITKWEADEHNKRVPKWTNSSPPSWWLP